MKSSTSTFSWKERGEVEVEGVYVYFFLERRRGSRSRWGLCLLFPRKKEEK
jgi:hypothetical protein